MGEKAKNIAGLFKDARTRTIVLVTAIALLVAMVVGVYSMRSRIFGAAGGSASVKGAPGGIESIPFQAPNPEYARIQEAQNVAQAQAAAAAGTSAVPTIVRSGTLVTLTPEQQAAQQQGLGFTGLARMEEAGSSFTPKEFNVGGGPAAGDFSAFCNPCVSCATGQGLNSVLGGVGLTTPVSAPTVVAQMCANAGMPVKDTSGKVLGTVGVDCKARDANGNIIGTVGPDGVVRDGNGKIIGQAGAVTVAPSAAAATGAASNLGTPVYDAQGRLIGYAGPDGKVRDLNGNVIGSLGPDGMVRDANGNVIGSVGVSKGTPVYDAQGRLIGYAGPDGKVRDLNGNIIGTLGPDGLVRDANGNIIGKAGSPGTAVYDAQGRLIGFAGPDGVVRDLNGNIIGTVGPDGIVRDANGKIIGKTGAIPLAGTPVYDENGRLIGYVGADGKVRDANGNIIGTVGADGLVRDLNGNIIGRALASKPGTAIFNKQGRLLGVLGADGNIRDAAGNIVGQLGIDGLVRDQNGNVIGTTNAAPQWSPDGLAFALQTGQIADQRMQQYFEQKRGQMGGQVAQLISSWAPVPQAYIAGSGSGTNGKSAGIGGQGGTDGMGSSGGSSGKPPALPVFIKAGTLTYGVINTAVNSDEPGPVLATIVSGDLKGARLIGSITNQGQKVMLTFNLMNLSSVGKTIPINAVAIDQKSARTALATATDNHYLMRYGSLFLSSFMQGYGQAIATSGSSISTNGLTTISSTQQLSPKQQIAVALGNVGTAWGNQMSSIFSTPPTVTIKSGTGVGILFLTDVAQP
jgi:hypothetical protein